MTTSPTITPASTPPPSRAEPILFYLLLVLCCVPIWLITYFPSNDGPEHLHNANIILHLNAPNYDIFRQYYQPNPNLSPNLVGHMILAGLLSFLSPLIAEKIFLTAYLITFALAARYALAAVRPGAKYLSILAFVLAYNWFFHMGFYNFCFSLSGFLLVVGFYLKHRDHLSWPRCAALAALLIILYFCHLSAVIMAMAAIGFLAFWQAVLERRHRPGLVLRVAVTFIPAAILVVLFLLQNRGKSEEISGALTLFERARYWLIFLCSFNRMEAAFSCGVMALILCVIFLRRRRLDIYWLGCVVVLFGMVLASLFIPQNIQRGGFVFERLVFFIVLLLLLCAGSLETGPTLRRNIWLGGAALAVVSAGYFHWQYLRIGAYIADYTSAAAHIADGATVMPISYESHVKDAAGRDLSFVTQPFRHVAGYFGAAHPIVDLDNYEADVGYFPIIWKQQIDPAQFMHQDQFLAYPTATGGLGKVDYVYIWIGGPTLPQNPQAQEKMARIQKQLDAGYVLIFVTEKKYGQLWQRRDLATQP